MRNERKNSEGYDDPTAYFAIKNADRVPEAITELINMYKNMASLLGFEITNRVHFRDKHTGKEWK